MPRLPAGVVLDLPVQCDATGRGYARVWAGNVLLLLATVGLGWPWAHRRTQQYFLRHTRVAGHSLDFRLPATVMWPRLAMALFLALGIGVAMSGSPRTGLVAVGVALLVWPLLAYLKLNQQVASVGWGDRRLWFDGAWHGLYTAASPPLLILLAAVLVATAVAWVDAAWPVPVLVGLAVAVWQLPRALWRAIRYRQQHLRLGPLRLRWGVPRTTFARGLRHAVADGLLAALPWTGGAVVLATAGMGAAQAASLSGWLGVLPAAVPLAVAGVLLHAHLRAHVFVAVWNKTGNRHLRFVISLQPAAYARLRGRHALRMVLTLGLYRPWALAEARRVLLQSCIVRSRVDPQVLQAYWSRRQGDAPPTELFSELWPGAVQDVSTAPSVQAQGPVRA